MIYWSEDDIGCVWGWPSLFDLSWFKFKKDPRLKMFKDNILKWRKKLNFALK